MNNTPVSPPGTSPRFAGSALCVGAPLPLGLDIRSAVVLGEIVEQYVEIREPVGGRTNPADHAPGIDP